MANNYSSQDLFEQALYDSKSTSIPIVLEKYEKLLLNRGDEQSILHANRLRQYRSEITNQAYFEELRKNFDDLYSLISQSNEFGHLTFSIDGRIKSVISTDKKIQKNLNENRSLDSLRDTTAFRIMLFGANSPSLVQSCYAVMNSVIKHMNSQYTLCEAAQLTDIAVEPDHSKIIIPKKSGIDAKYSFGVKDYILHPKKNLYQSLHVVFRRPYGGECFEIQVRTYDMHVLAESGNAKHSVYKKKKYSNTIDLDRSRIHIPGYGVSPEGELFDFIGLERGLQILKIQKTF